MLAESLHLVGGPGGGLWLLEAQPMTCKVSPVCLVQKFGLCHLYAAGVCYCAASGEEQTATAAGQQDSIPPVQGFIQ